VISQYDEDTGERIDRAGAIDTIPKGESEQKSDRAFTFRKYFITDELKQRSISSEVTIEYEPLQKLLHSILAKYESAPRIKTLSSPFQSLIWCWDDANNIAEATNDSSNEEEIQARLDLKQLLQIISTSSGSTPVDRWFRERQSFLETKMISHNSLWAVFPRGCSIVGKPFENEPQIFLVQACDSVRDSQRSDQSSTRIICYAYDWDGTKFNRVPYSAIIGYYDDKRKINELPFYPLEFHQDIDPEKRLVDELEKRGQKFRSYCVSSINGQTFRYKGSVYHKKGAGLFTKLSTYDDDDSLQLFNDIGRSEYTSAAALKLEVGLSLSDISSRVLTLYLV
jgi:hypothetical protein